MRNKTHEKLFISIWTIGIILISIGGFLWLLRVSLPSQSAFVCIIVGSFLIVLSPAIITRKHIGRKDKIGKKLRICYLVGLFVLTTCVVAVLIQDWASYYELLERTSNALFWIFMPMSVILICTHNEIKNENIAKTSINI